MRPTNRGLVLAVMCCGMFLVLLDVSIVNVALPSIGHDLGADVSGMQWVVDGYAVSIASLLLAGGTMGDRFGHRRIVLTGLAVFGTASAVCGLAPDAGVLVGARVCQGIGAALMLPGSLAVIADVFPGRHEQARALGIWAGVSSLALPAGPTLGGLLVSATGWRWVFLVNVPVVAAALALVPLLVHAGAGRHTASLDVPGVVTAAITLGATVFAVIEFGRTGVGTVPVVAAVVALAGLVALVLAERRSSAPMLPTDLLRRPAFAGANVSAFVMNLVTNGTIFVVTLYLQQVHGLAPWLAGLLLLPAWAPIALASPAVGRLTARVGPRPPMVAGAVLAAAGQLCTFLVPTTWSYPRLLPALVGLGVGIALFTTAVVVAAIRAVPAERSGLASGMNNTARQAGTALGVATFGAVAGSTHPASSFVAGMHHAGIAGASLWLVALVLTVTTV
ncbi:MAG: MFS transporter [Acidothermales bacterium]|nr:MFS transporter [Acidothermales bacterium]